MLECDRVDNPWSKLKEATGQLLRGAEGLCYHPSDGAASSLDQLRIVCGEFAFRFKCSADGETLTIDSGDLLPVDLGEYGHMGPTDLADTPAFSSLMNTSLRRVYRVQQMDTKSRIGVRLVFTGGELMICNWGDDLAVWSGVPENLFEAEDIQLVPV